jgi:hypothetical protein
MPATDPDRKTFVLGAGFSVQAGFPLVRDLRSAVIHFIERCPQPDWSADLMPGAKGFPKGQFYEGLAAADPGASLGFEELLIALRRFADQDWHPANRTRTILEAGCARLFWNIQTKLTLPACYHNFARWLFIPAGKPKHNIVSFNWDLVIERALEDEGVNWFYSRITENSVGVLKPHGSINWSNHRGHGLVADSDVWSKAVLDGTLDCLREDRFRDPFNTGVNEQFRYLILPGDSDAPSVSPSQPIWELARLAIVRSSAVVFIGYSLPFYDNFSRDFFLQYCGGKSIEVHNPSQSHLYHFRDVFGPATVLKCETFEDSIYGAAPHHH